MTKENDQLTRLKLKILMLSASWMLFTETIKPKAIRLFPGIQFDLFEPDSESNFDRLNISISGEFATIEYTAENGRQLKVNNFRICEDLHDFI